MKTRLFTVAGLKKRILSDSEINNGRQSEIDLARAVIIFCLALIHCTIECTSDEGLTSGIPYLFDTVIGGPFSAPMYMFVMGIGMVYTKKCEPAQHFQRGVRIFITGYILNIFRFLIPYLIGYAITGESEKYVEPLLYKVLGNDILIFAGLAMILLALFIRLKVPVTVMLMIGIALSGVGTLLTGVDVGCPLGNIFLGYLIGTEDAAGMVISDFPICNWLLFPICGYIFGRVLKRVKDKKAFYRTVSLPAMLIAVIYFAFGLHYEFGMFGEGQNCYYHLNIADAFASLALAIGVLGIYYAIGRVLPQKVVGVTNIISKNITAIYCIHWVLISVSVNLLLYIIRGTQELPAWMVLILGSGISAVSIVIAYYFRLWKERCVRYEKVS